MGFKVSGLLCWQTDVNGANRLTDCKTVSLQVLARASNFKPPQTTSNHLKLFQTISNA